MTYRILAIDDNSKNLQVIGSLLRANSYQINLVQSAVQALEVLDEINPDLILCDILMPEMDGFEFCQKVKSQDKYADIPLIFLTASNEEEFETKGLEIGAVDFIRKPINPPVLLARISTHLKLTSALKDLKEQNRVINENIRLRDEVERIARHDLKNPLQAVIGLPELMLMDHNINPKQKEMLEHVLESGYKILTMVDNSMNIYKMETGKYNYIPDQVDLADICRTLKKQSISYISSKGLNIQLILNGHPLSQDDRFIVVGEKLLYYTMLSNLLKNACEASPKLGIITIFMSNLKQELIIENDGSIPPEIRDSFFEKYKTHGKDSGSGIGTYSAKLMAETMNHRLVIDDSIPQKVRLVLHLR